MNPFVPVLFSIATIPFAEGDETLGKIHEALGAIAIYSSSGFAFEFSAVAFANIHPDLNQILLEVQAASEEDLAKGIEVVETAVATATEESLFWIDVTKEALDYHNPPKE